MQSDQFAQEQADGAAISSQRVRRKLEHTGHPYITLKAAITLDGKIATAGGASQWITGEAGRELAHRLRARHDGVLVGINTVRADDPRLTVRLPGCARQPARIVLDSQCGISPGARLLAADGARRIVITGCDAPAAQMGRLRDMGVAVHPCQAVRPAPGEFLPYLRAEGLETMLVEGGGQVHANMIAHGVADELVLIIAGKIAGDDAPGWCAAFGMQRLEDMPRLELQPAKQVGEDLVVRGYFLGGVAE